MLDDEIVFLGSKQPLTPSARPQRPVTGIALHIEKSGGTDAYGMLFRRANTSVVHIGRRSGFDTDRRSQDSELANAMFRCAVVSRKHAKIAFSDSGHAYLIDLGSHHGTHIRKLGDKFSRCLKQETPTLLAHGDVVTFGKSVGKNEECVKPVVARIELLYCGQSSMQSTSPIRPLIVPSNASPSMSDKSSAKSSSGRYGVHESSPSSSDESSFNSGIYSDIEEIPAPSSSKPVASQLDSSNSSTGSFGHAFNVLKRLLPPSHPPGTQPREISQLKEILPSVAEIVERPLPQMSSIFFNPFKSNRPPVSSQIIHLSPAPDAFALPHGFSGIDFHPVGFDASQHDIYEISDALSNKSRSNSPMDLASPSPAVEVLVSRPLSIPPPPVQLPRLSTPPPPSLASGPDSVSPVSSSPRGISPSSPRAHTAMSRTIVTALNNAAAAIAIPSPQAWDDHQPFDASVVFDDSDPTATRFKNIEDTLAKLQSDVIKLQNHRRKYKSRFNTNVQVISGKLGEFDDRLAEVNAEYTMLFDQVDTIHHVDIPDLQAHLETLQERMDDIPSPFTTPEPRESTPTPAPALHEREDVKASIQTLRDLVDEMRNLRETAQTAHAQMTAEWETFKAGEVAMARIAQTQAEARAQALQTPVLTSLKRKRDDTDENEEVDESEGGQGSVEKVGDTPLMVSSTPAGLDKDVVMDDNVLVPPTNLEVAAAQKLEGPSPRKRARRFATVVAQTATAVTIGAVVTWSALAFS
ncbi:hypothetical protein B0H34DRAFT_810671 [Crassisporium funariophilum]|nr:hypothetical protein B0H34DRAFT_810671 [Crassisporium funariophilum]